MEAVIRLDNETYRIIDHSENGLTLSVTTLYGMKETRGHDHSNQEIYYIVSGSGVMILGESRIKLKAGDVVNIPVNVFHKVYNKRKYPLVFVCTYNK